MSGSLNIEIAGINLAVLCPAAKIFHDSDPAYTPFIKSRKDPSAIDVEVRLELDNLPDTAGLKKVFDSGQSWSIFLNRDEYLLVLSPPALKQKPVWMARFGRVPSKMTVYCGEMLIRRQEGNFVVSNPVRYPLDQLFLMYVLAQEGGAVIHAAGIAANERGYIFLGRSGAGKSTLTRQFAARQWGTLLSDDRVVVRKSCGAFRAFGTPWPGEASAAANESVPLTGIFFISHGSENQIRDVSRKDALERLLPVTSIPWYDGAVMAEILEFCDDLCSHIPSYELSFRPDSEVVGFLEEFVSR